LPPADGPSREYELIHRRPTHRAKKFSCAVERIRFPDGRELEREVIHHPGAAVVVPFLPDGRLVLVNVWRHAAGGTLLEVPAGTLEPGEEPVRCAARELEEETGYRADRLEPLGSWYPSPGLMDESMHLFRAEGLVLSEARPEDDEMVEPVILTVAEAVAKVRDRTVRDGKTLLALFLTGVISVPPRAPAGDA
jgi:ADP-ribose pyrophosphatase